MPDPTTPDNRSSEAPSASAGTAVPAPPASPPPAAAPAANAAAPRPAPSFFTAPRAPAQMLYRLVEIVRDDQGRLREEGRVWHADLQQVRRFARAVAGSSAAHRVVVADGAGRIMEELSASVGYSAPTPWGDWKQIPVPPLPPAPRGSAARLRHAKPPKALAAPPPPSPSSPPAAPALPAAAVAAAAPATPAVPPEPPTQGVEVELP